MERSEINNVLQQLEATQSRNLVIIDYGNVEKWQRNLGWKIGFAELARLVKIMSRGSRLLRRFYYGADYGRNEHSTVLTPWSHMVLHNAEQYYFEVCTKPVKYIYDSNYKSGFLKKCNFDIEMTVDMIRHRDQYDNAVLFSGDGDMAYVVNFLRETYGKRFVVFGARDHIGKELIDAHHAGAIDTVLFAEDFEYRLDKDRHRRGR